MKAAARLALLVSALGGGGLHAQIPRETVRLAEGVELPTGSRRTIHANGGMAVTAWASENVYTAAVTTDGGVTWPRRASFPLAPEQRASALSGGVFASGDLIIAFGSGTVPSLPPQLAELWMFRSFDAGMVWEEPRMIVRFADHASVDDSIDIDIQEDADGHRIAVAYQTGTLNSQLAVVASQDSGETFSPPTFVSTPDVEGIQEKLDIAVDGEAIHVAWTDRRYGSLGDRTMFYQRSLDAGATWLPSDVQLSEQQGAYGIPNEIFIEVGGSTVVVAWPRSLAKGSTSAREVFVANSADSGSTWTSEHPVFNEGPFGFNTHVRGLVVQPDGASVAVCYELPADNTRISTSSDGGGTFGEALTFTLYRAPFFVSLGAERILLVAREAGEPTSVGRISEDGGDSFGAPFAVDHSEAVGTLFDIAHDAQLDSVVSVNVAPQGVVEDVSAGGFSTCAGASAIARNAGTNPESLSLTNLALIGGVLDLAIDAGSTGHPLAIAFAYGSPGETLLPDGQALLVSLEGPELLGLAPAPGPLANFSLAIPNLPTLCGVTITLQGAHVGGAQSFALTNAYDLTAAAY